MTAELLQGTMTTENGTAYTIAYPSLSETVTIGDIFSIITRKDLPVRELIENLINHMASFQNGDLVELPDSFTGYHSDIIIQYEDAMIIQSTLKILNAFLALIDQYNLSLNYDYDELSNLGAYETIKAFFSSYPDILKAVPERAEDQADSKSELLNALDKIKEILPIIWYKSPPEDPFKTHLISISDDSNSEDYAKLNEQIDALKVSLNGFEIFSNLTQENDGGFSFSLQPFFSEEPFPIQSLLLDLESTDTGYDFIHGYEEGFSDTELLMKYGIIKNLLPTNFAGKVLVIYNSNGTIYKTVYYSNENSHSFSPISGELNNWSMENSIFPNEDWSNPPILSYESPNAGTWIINDYMYDNESSGSFYFYNGNLDINDNGVIDALEIINGATTTSSSEYSTDAYISEQSLNFPPNFNPSQITIKESQLEESAPTSLKGFIVVQESKDEYTNDYFVYYYISNNDFIFNDGISIQNYHYNYERGIERYQNNEHGHMSDHDEHGHMSDHDEHGHMSDQIVYYNFDTTYTATAFEEGKECKLAIYPSYLDLDDDGLEDGTEMVAGIKPNIIALPSYSEINSAIAYYSSKNSQDSSDEDSLDSQSSPELNPNALEDLDNDNMPDSLEEKFGGSSSNANDANVALNAILNDTYTLNELRDLRLGSTLFEISEGLASFNILLEESNDLVSWSEYGTYSLELSNDSDENIQFFRFKMAE